MNRNTFVEYGKKGALVKNARKYEAIVELSKTFPKDTLNYIQSLPVDGVMKILNWVRNLKK